MLLNHIRPEVEKILRKNQKDFLRNRSTSLILLVDSSKGIYVKNIAYTGASGIGLYVNLDKIEFIWVLNKKESSLF